MVLVSVMEARLPGKGTDVWRNSDGVDDGGRKRLKLLQGGLRARQLGAFFVYSATAEERNLSTVFPSAYPSYRSRTKTLNPFVL